MPDCAFCPPKLVQDEVLEEKEHVFVKLSNPRLMPGHVLVIPKRHVSSLSELSPVERAELFDTAMALQEKIKALSPGNGCDLSQHDRPFMPTTKLTVPQHLHVHLRPRTWQDGYYQAVSRHETAVFQELPEGEIERFREILKPEK